MKEKAERNDAMRALKAKGHTAAELAEMFGISDAMVYRICKGITDVKRNQPYKNQFTSGDYDQIGNFKRLLSEKCPNTEYVCGYKNMDSPVTIRCKICGYTFERSVSTIRHGRKIICPNCRVLDNEARKKERASEHLKEMEKLKAERDKRRAELERRRAEDRESRRHKCPVCGTSTVRQKYCSSACANRVTNAKHEAKRRIKIMSAMVDKDITLEKLYERDAGMCWICGMMCEWGDKEEKSGTIIAGNFYPSIDHVKPLSEGGSHSWSNVKLAHRRCNTVRYYAPWGR